MAVGFNRMVVLLLVAAATLWRCSSAATYMVGDSLGWIDPPNANIYTDWASNKTFVVGDILVFNFATGRHDVTEVTKSAYDSCNGNNPISTESNSPVRITLTSAGNRHFICTIPGHCNNGQKLSVTVRATSAPTPQPSSPAPSPVPVSVPAPSISPEPSSSDRSPSPTPSFTPSSPVPSRAPTRQPMTYVVGDSLGWSVPNNPTFYESWAQDKTFVVGDILEFNFVIQTHNVAKVTKDNYGSCSGESPISISTNPPVRITLSEPGEHFYICTVAGHCNIGQKLAVNVTGSEATTPPPSSDTVPSTPSPATAPPPPSAAPSVRTSAFSAALLAVAVALVY
ncbi:blue copper protein-like [Cucurbita maxima]|uniref:Blue copper protein-like n=1 Tax=Cucurbita maxima TaxID=3661 RepID=A0A6J1HQ41_CUCMA|nr:blue copper protein-like [Cucurbita maxima]